MLRERSSRARASFLPHGSPARTGFLLAICASFLVPSTAPVEAREPDEASDGLGSTVFGEFTGTWARFEPEHKIVVMLRRSDDSDTWAVRLIWKLGTGLELDTGWDGRAEYEFGGVSGTLTLDVDESRTTDDRIYCSWLRLHESGNGTKLEESGEIEIYRAGIGRNLVWRQSLERRRETVEPGAEEPSISTSTGELSWFFAFQSRRMLLWDEVYW